MSEWISVKDRLPEDGQMVLVWTDTLLDPEIEMSKFSKDKGFLLADEWGYLEAYSKYTDELPTHWMPLPEPPSDRD